MSAKPCPAAGPDACQSITACPPASRLICPINLTTVTSRPLHAVLLPPEPAGRRMLEALPAALDGSGPAILPLDPALPPARLAALLDALAPSCIETTEGTNRLSPATPGSSAGPGARPDQPGVRPDVAIVIATSGSTGQPKGVELTGAALLASARATLRRIGASPGQRWLCCLPTFHVAGVQVLVRSLLAGAEPVISTRLVADLRGAAAVPGGGLASGGLASGGLASGGLPGEALAGEGLADEGLADE